MQSIHQRMPIIITAENYSAWLDTELHDIAVLQTLLAHNDYHQMTKYKVNNDVNNPRHNHDGLIIQQ